MVCFGSTSINFRKYFSACSGCFSYRLNCPSSVYAVTLLACTDSTEFKKLLARDPDQLTRNLAHKLLTYASGRKIGFSDRKAIDEIVLQTRDQGYGFRSLIQAVAQSELIRTP